MAPHPKHIAVDAADMTHRRVAQPRGIFRDNIEHRLDIRRRAGNDTQDFARRRLLLQRSLSSWNNRTFSMAITAWSAKVLSSSICAR